MEHKKEYKEDMKKKQHRFYTQKKKRFYNFLRIKKNSSSRSRQTGPDDFVKLLQNF